MSYRSPAFSRAKKKNRDKVDDLSSQGKLNVLMKSNVLQIFSDGVKISTDGKGHINIKNDAVIVCAGGILPTPFLKEMGIEVETKYGTA